MMLLSNSGKARAIIKRCNREERKAFAIQRVINFHFPSLACRVERRSTLLTAWMHFNVHQIVHIMKMKTHPYWSFSWFRQHSPSQPKQEIKNPDRSVLITFRCLHKTQSDCEETSTSDCISTTVGTKLIASNALTHTWAATHAALYN